MNKYLDQKRYWHFLVNKIITLISPIIKIWEKKQYKKYASKPIKHQPIFIIGAPRTGSTILYQTLTNQLDVLYIDNLACRFHKNLFFGFWLSNLFFKQKAHNCFSSNHGATKGLRSPSECGEFWYRWLPRDRHFIDHQDVTDKMVKEIREEITSVINKYDKPLVFKNLNAGQRLRLLQKCFPEAKFIFCKRNPFFTVQSILNAKRKVGLADNDFWSVMPKNVDELRKLSWPEQIVGQVYYLEKQITVDLTLFNKQNIIEVDYQHFTSDTLKIMSEKLELKERKEFEPAKIELREKINLLETECKAIESQVDRYFI